MKKFFLFALAIASLSLVSCGGNQSPNEGDPGIDPNDPNQRPPQEDTNTPPTSDNIVEENNSQSDANAAANTTDNKQSQEANKK